MRFPVADLKPGAKVRGTTIAELGAGNQPIDMVLYKKDGHQYVLMANTRHGVLKIATDQFGSASGLTDPVQRHGRHPGREDHVDDQRVPARPARRDALGDR